MTKTDMGGPPVIKHDSLLLWDQLKPERKDNEFILSGYRQPSASLRICARSALRLHNETGNIWTHAIATIWFLYALGSFYYLASYSSTKLHDTWPIFVYYFGVLNCFTCSATFHTCSNHSGEAFTFGNQLDHLGIVLVIWASAIPCTYFTLYEAAPKYRYTHYTLISTFAVILAVLTSREKFRQPRHRQSRVYMYTLLGVSTFLPILQGLKLYGLEELNQRMSLDYFLGLAVWNLSGGIIYALRIPERWYTGQFDIWGSSHQIMHLFTFFGALTNERGLERALQYWADKQ